MVELIHDTTPLTRHAFKSGGWVVPQVVVVAEPRSSLSLE